MRSQQSPEKKSLITCVKRQADNPHLQLFAKLWNKMKQDPGLRDMVGIHSWAAELTIIADLVLEHSQGGTAEKVSMPTQSRQLYQKNPRNSSESESGYETAQSNDEDSTSDDSSYKS